MNGELGNSAAKGAVWATIDRFGTMAIQFTVNLILARLLVPEDFGIVGMLAIFIAVSQTLIDGGFGSALIQKKNPTQTDYSTIFYWNLGFSSFLYLILFISSPLIAKFFGMPLLSAIMKVIALNLIITGIFTIQRTRLQKELAFKTIAIVNLSSYIIGSISAIIFAKNGFGPWSLVWFQIISGSSSIVILWAITGWLPSRVFSFQAMKKLIGFGGFILAANILQAICQNIQGLIIGKCFSATQMGYYSQAYKLDQVSSYSIPQVIVQVMYPVYSSLQDDRMRLNAMVLMNMRVVSFIVYPILAVLILIAHPLIDLLYGDKWLPSVPYFRILCVGGFFVALQNLNFYAVAAVGKSRSLFNWSFYKWGFLLSALTIGMTIGMYGILWAMVLSSANIFITNAYLAQRHLGLRIWAQLRNILPIVATVAASTLAGALIDYNGGHPFIGMVVAISAYLILSYFLKLQAFADTRQIAGKILSR